MAEVHKGRIAMFEYQEPEVLNQPNPVQNTWYTLADLTNARVYGIGVNIEDTDETLELEVTIDGVAPGFIAPLAATNSTQYYSIKYPDGINRVVIWALTAVVGDITRRAFQCEGRTILIRLRKTTAAGAGNLTGVVEWGQMTDIP